MTAIIYFRLSVCDRSRLNYLSTIIPSPFPDIYTQQKLTSCSGSGAVCHPHGHIVTATHFYNFQIYLVVYIQTHTDKENFFQIMEKNIRLHPPHRAEIRPTLLHAIATTPRSHKYYIQRELAIQYKYHIQGGIYSLVSQGCCKHI